MTEAAMHPAAPHDLPGFITAPGETDPLMVGSVILLIVLVMALGGLYFWLHSIPERIAHGTGKIQFQLVGVLALLALFTHINLFWVLALLLALVPIPDFRTPLASMAESLSKMVSGRIREPVGSEVPAIASQPPVPLAPVVTLSPVEQGAANDEGSGEMPVAAEGHKP